MKYEVVFDVARDGYSGWLGIFCGVAVMVGAGVFHPLRRLFPPRRLRLVPSAISALAGCWLVVWTLATGLPYLFLRSDLASGQCALVEGVVTDFHPMPSSGKGEESFDVSGVHFVYSDFVITPGFHKTTYRDGPIREGLHPFGRTVIVLDEVRGV